MFSAQIEAPIEYYRIHRIEGDGRCLFRALVRLLTPRIEPTMIRRKEFRDIKMCICHMRKKKNRQVWKSKMCVLIMNWIDQLRMAVHNALCLSKELKHEFRDVIQTLESPLPKQKLQFSQNSDCV